MLKLKNIISNIPSKPWVYIMKNISWKFIYVWKSINLKARVNSYFNWKWNLNFAKTSMIKQVKNIDYIETKNELEALVLETNLIKKEKPKYNILMKDDKNLTYIKISNDIIPEVYKTRIKSKDWQYFWPYPSLVNINLILDSLKKIFKIRNCKVKFVKKNNKLILSSKWGKTIPCLDFYIWLCSAPCILEQDNIKQYQKNIESLKDFLKWNSWKILKELEENMKEKAKQLKFEEATKIKNQIKNIESLSQKQIARDAIPGNNDVLVYLEKYGKIFIALTEIIEWEIVWINNYIIENKLNENKDELIKFFLEQRYIDNWEKQNKFLNKKLITKEKIKDKNLLRFLKYQNISLENPKLWHKIEVINFTQNNLINYAYKLELNNISKKTFTKNTMLSVLKKLWYNTQKTKWIIFECFDISHTSGNFTVASKSVIIDWKSINSKYRKYKINSISNWEIDDFKSIKEVIYRRSLEAIEKSNFPDLFIIDWWKWQLTSAIDWINEAFKFSSNNKEIWKYDFNICSIAKKEEEIFIPKKITPIIFEKWSHELMLIQKIRDEAHRFAISFHIKSRTNAMKKNILEELPGFGPSARKKLFNIAWRIDNIKSWEKKDLEKILNKNQILTLIENGIYPN